MTIRSRFEKQYSFLPCSGAQGEYAGLMAIRSYLVKNGQEHRTVSEIQHQLFLKLCEV